MRRNARGWRIGQDHPKAKLSDNDVELIRSLYDAGLKPREIAVKFEGVPRDTLNDILYYRTRM